jgi:3-mercaptopyruvate sulfurtransferase SseA
MKWRSVLGSYLPVLWGALVIVGVSVSLGLGYNQLRPRGIPLRNITWQKILKIEGTCAAGKDTISEIDLDTAAKLFGLKNVTFVDARPSYVYEAGHIAGAFNIPVREGNRGDQPMDFLDLSQIPKDGLVITYCDQNDCLLSKLLAEILASNGCSHLRILSGGWPVWAARFDDTDRVEH